MVIVTIREAVILAGGKGKRMRGVTMDKYPKGLTPIQGRSIIEWEIEWLAREGVDYVILAVGYLGKMIEDKLSNQIDTKFGLVEIVYSHEKEKLGSGGAFKLASERIQDKRCYVVNGDVLCDDKLKQIQEIHIQTDALATMYLVQMRSPYGIVEENSNLITNFVEKPMLPHYIHGGIDIIEQNIFHRFPAKGQMEDTIFVELAEEKRFAAFKASSNVFWESIDSEKDFDDANKNWNGL